MKKKDYQTPTMQVVKLQHQAHLLQAVVSSMAGISMASASDFMIVFVFIVLLFFVVKTKDVCQGIRCLPPPMCFPLWRSPDR